MAELVSGNELARRLGVTEGAVRKHVRRGMYKRRKDGLFNFEECRLAWQTTRDPDNVIKGIAGAEAVSKKTDAEPQASSGAADGPRIMETSLTKARTAQAAIKAQREKIELDRTRGALIRTDHAFAACRAVISVVVERMDGAAAQIGARAANMDAVAVERIARDVLSAVRSEIAAMQEAITEVVNDGPGAGG